MIQVKSDTNDSAWQLDPDDLNQDFSKQHLYFDIYQLLPSAEFFKNLPADPKVQLIRYSCTAFSESHHYFSIFLVV